MTSTRGRQIISDKEGVFLNLAYDVRKAFQRERETIKPPTHCKEMGIRFGVQILWPVLLLQQRIMRLSLAYLVVRFQHLHPVCISLVGKCRKQENH